MAPHPVEPHLVRFKLGQQGFPQVAVQHGLSLPLLRRLAPAVGLPVLQPTLVNGIYSVAGIRVYLHLARARKRPQTFYDRRELHAIVGGIGMAARQFLLDTAVAEDSPPAPRSGIAGAGAIGVELDFQAASSSGRPKRLSTQLITVVNKEM